MCAFKCLQCARYRGYSSRCCKEAAITVRLSFASPCASTASPFQADLNLAAATPLPFNLPCSTLIAAASASSQYHLWSTCMAIA
jgi:hypothetical protein